MKVEDFRIGNLVEQWEVGLTKVVGINSDGLYLDCGDHKNKFYFIKHISPILITEIGLKNLGFTKPEYSPYYMKSNIEVSVVGDSINIKTSWWQEVKYIHHLQNIYYDIKGEELMLSDKIELPLKG